VIVLETVERVVVRMSESDDVLQQVLLQLREQQILLSKLTSTNGLIPDLGIKLTDIATDLAALRENVHTNSEMMRANASRLANLPCAEMAADLEVLKCGLRSGRTNWDRVTTVGLGVLQALATAAVLYLAGMK